ncbi:MAG: ionic transporter y4hA [Betaproteobacteria bacterium]
MRLPRVLDLPAITLIAPLAAGGLLFFAHGDHSSVVFIVLTTIVLICTVLVAVFHAEIIAHRIGEPLGTLVLALAVTVIEVSLIVSMMLSGGEETRSLARDTVFATVMIICNGVVGICLLAGSIQHRIVRFRAEGTSAALSVLAALTTLTLILPQFTTTVTGPIYSTAQLAFASLMSLILYLLFVFIQTVRHKDHFLPKQLEGGTEAEIGHPDEQPSRATSYASFVLLLISLVGVVGLAKQLAPAIKSGVDAISAPQAVIGIAIALLVLLPETLAALRAAHRNQIQTSLNLALGSALATIGLTIPAVATVAIFMGMTLDLGLPAKEIVLLALTLLVSAITVVSGQATIMQGAVHLVLFAAFIFLAIIP